MFVRNAITSWLVTASISSTSALLNFAWSRIHLASSLVIPLSPSSAWASQARTSISCQTSYLCSSSKMFPISGRV